MQRSVRVFVMGCILAVASGFFHPCAATPPPPEVIRILANLPGYYAAATPAQIRTVIGKLSLQNVAAVTEQTRSTATPGRLAVTPLMRAALETPYPEVIDILVKAGCDVNAVTGPFEQPETADLGHDDGNDRAALHFAVRNPNPAVLKALLRHKPDLSVKTGERSRYTAFELAAMMPGRAEHMRLLLAAGARPEPPREHRKTIWQRFLGLNSVAGEPLNVLHYAKGLLAAPEEAADKVRALVAHKVRPEGREGTDALRRALIAGQNRAASLLLDAGANPAWRDAYGRNMLHAALSRPPTRFSSNAVAIPQADPALLARLTKANDVNAADSNGATPLRIACASGMGADVAKTLIGAGAKYSFEGNALILAAVKSQHDCADLVAYLLSLGFSAVDRGSANESPLMTTRRNPEKPRCAQALVKAGAAPEELLGAHDRDFSVAAGIVDEEGNILVRSPGLSESDKKRMAEEKRRIMAKARENPEDALYDPAVYLVASPAEIRELIGKRSISGVRVEKRKIAVYRTSGPVAQAMVIMLPVLVFQKEFWTGTRTVKEEYTPLAEAAGATPHPEVVHMLVKAGCKVTDMRSEALLKSLFNPNPRVLEAILHYKPDLSAAMFYLGTPLHYLAASDPAAFKKEHFRLLLQAGANPNIVFGKGGATPIMQAASYRNTEAGRMLLAAGATITYADRMGDRVLEKAISARAWALAADLLQAGAPVRYEKGRSPLEKLAGIRGAEPAFTRALLAATGPKSAEGTRAVMRAANEGNSAVLQVLLDGGACADNRLQALDAALVAAVSGERDDAATVGILLQKGARAAVTDGRGTPVLVLAATKGKVAQMAALVKGGAKVNDANREGVTALMAVARPARQKTGRMAASRLLITAGADVNRHGGDGKTPLFFVLDAPDLAALYIKAGAKVNAPDATGKTALMAAADEKRYADAVPLLLQAGADPFKKDRHGKTPLERALEADNGKAVAFLQAALFKRGRR